jgi:tetratricopeptide (TPR) repeat protein
LGNKAFLNKLYEEAISFYSKALENAGEDNEELHIYYSNSKLTHVLFLIGAATYLEMNEMDKALEDSKKSIELNSEFVKGYLRKAQSERELLLNEESLVTVTKALELDPDNDAVKRMYEEIKQEWDDDHSVAEDNVHKQCFNHLEEWLHEGGSNYEKLKIRFYNPIYRGVHAAKRIRVSNISI